VTRSGGSIRRNVAPRWALIAGVLLYLLSRLTGGVWLGLVACAIGATGLCGLVLARLLKTARLTARGEPRVAAGAARRVQIVVRNSGRWPLPPLRVTYEREGFDWCVVLVPALRPGGEASVDTDMRACARGIYEDARMSVAVASPLGIVGAWMSLPPKPVIVHPAPTLAMPSVVGGVGGVLASADRPGRGIDVHGLRSWLPGDAAASVHWRTSARRGELLVLERAEELGGGFAVLAGQFRPDDAGEAAVARAAATAVAAIRDGRRVSLFGGTSGNLLASADRVAVLDWFAAVRGDILPSGDVAVAAGRAAGWGGTVLWLASGPPPPDVARAIRSCGVALVPVGRAAT
jgi:uncharacterized protein (DUF58 family)